MRFTLGKAGLAYTVSGDHDTPPLVLINGLGGALQGWFFQTRHFSKSRFVVAYDHRGNGKSPDSDGVGELETYAQDLLEVMDSANVQRADLCGVSFGGRLAQYMALNFPERVRSLTLVATQAGPAGTIEGHSVLDKMGTMTGEEILEQVVPLLFGAQYIDDHRRHLKVFANARAKNPLSSTALKRQMDAARDFDPRDDLHRVTAPTLIIHGTLDRLCPIEEAYTLESAIPNAELVELPSVGHSPNIEAPSAFNAALESFLARVDEAHLFDHSR
jgi:pimeloyl-ACP methyl ester carboxylesterase